MPAIKVSDFVPFTPMILIEIKRAGVGVQARHPESLLSFDWEPLFQERLLEKISVSRSRGHHRNLLAAATGTGKMAMAAVDCARLRNGFPPGCSSWRIVQRDPGPEYYLPLRHSVTSFGEK